MVTRSPELQSTPDCLDIERLGEPLTEVEQAHLRSCSRCEAEMALWRSYDDSTPAANEGAAVQWVVSELRRRRMPDSVAPPRRRWLATLAWRPALALTAVALVAAAGLLVWDPTPGIDPLPPGGQTYRTGTVSVIGPRGDLAQPPSELVWEVVEGAVRYEVRLLEIDHTPLWSTSADSTRVTLPRQVVTRIVPGKTLLWSVTAVDQTARSIAESGMQSFRVTVASDSGRN